MVSDNALPPSSSLLRDKHFPTLVHPPKSSQLPLLSPLSSNKSKPPPPPPHSPPLRRGGYLAQPPPNQHEKSPTKPSTESTNNYPSLKSPLVIGISAGVGVLIIFLLISCICSIRKKKKKIHDPMHYYADSGPKDSDYYTSSVLQPKWQNGKGLPQTTSVGGWQSQALSTIAPESETSSACSGPQGPPLPPPSPNISLGFIKSTFTYEELAAATGGFSQANLLGQGGFGYVYKGVLPNGKEIAVKQLKSGSRQGEREFHAEVDIISWVHHRHLVSLVGYCIAGSQRMLIYDFVPNKTLDYHLHGKGLPTMDWPVSLEVQKIP